MKEKKKGIPRLTLINLSKSGRGVSKDEDNGRLTLKRFFILLKDNIGKLLSVNIFFVLGNFPVFFLIAALAGYTQHKFSLPLSDLWQNLSALISTGTVTPADTALFALEGLQHQTLTPGTLTYVFYGISALTLFTFGPVNVGTVYILRNIAKREPVFVWSDFWYSVKKNLRQALPFGALDAIVCALLPFNIYTLVINNASFFSSLTLWANVIILLVWFIMRPYIYIQMVTFSLSVFKMMKNALIFTLLGIKRNLLALIGTVLALFLEVLFILGLNGILLPAAIAFPFLIMLSMCAFMKVYAAFAKIKELMIDPYLAEHPEEIAVPDDTEVIMHDDVTKNN